MSTMPYTIEQIQGVCQRVTDYADEVSIQVARQRGSDLEWHEKEDEVTDLLDFIARDIKVVRDMVASNRRTEFIESPDPLDDPTHVRHIDPNVHNTTVTKHDRRLEKEQS